MIKQNPLPNEHAARQKPPELFKTFRRSKSFRNKPLPPGISVIYGIRKEKGPRGGSTEIQSFRFDKNKWGVKEAKKWLKDNGFETKIEKAVKKTTRKKNPYSSIDEIIDKLKENPYVKNVHLIGQGAFGDVYYFYLPQRAFILNDIFLDKGEHAIKIIVSKDDYLSKYKIDKLMLMSKYGIIPKIYYIDRNSIIMNYIEGVTLTRFLDKHPSYYSLNIIQEKLNNLNSVWKKLGFSHEDLRNNNVLITEDLKVYLIDPVV